MLTSKAEEKSITDTASDDQGYNLLYQITEIFYVENVADHQFK